MFRTGFPDNQVGIDGIVDTSDQGRLRQNSHSALRGPTTAIGPGEMPMFADSQISFTEEYA